MAEGVGFEPTVILQPQRFSRPSRSSAPATLRGDASERPRRRSAKKPVSSAAHSSARHSRHHARFVVQPLVGGEVVERSHRARFQVGGPEHHSTDLSGPHRTGAQRAGLEGDHERRLVQATEPTAPAASRSSEHLGVCGRVTELLSLVVTPGHDVGPQRAPPRRSARRRGEGRGPPRPAPAAWRASSVIASTVTWALGSGSCRSAAGSRRQPPAPPLGPVSG